MNEPTKIVQVENGPLSDEFVSLALAISASLGITLGLLIGLITNNMATWLVVGICFGLVTGLFLITTLKKKQNEQGLLNSDIS
ncbi:hypothetical protein EYS14_04650 [Alteromonadaceae bacterium M269]|nr:hypothetical protein EYS14_04650 [Alteromonadaceae bacterium M269]